MRLGGVGSLLPLLAGVWLSLFLTNAAVDQTTRMMESETNFAGGGEIHPQLRVNVVNGFDFPVEVYYDDNQGGILLV
jgi:hypothetical protein